MPTLRESVLHRTDSFKISRTLYKMLVKPFVVTTAHGRTDARTHAWNKVGRGHPRWARYRSLPTWEVN